MTAPKQHPERGSTLVIVTVTIPIILLIIALVVDLGHIYVERAEIQTAADFAAQAAAASLSDRVVDGAAAKLAAGATEVTDNPFYYLTDAELLTILADTDIVSIAEYYVLRNAPDAEYYPGICEQKSATSTSPCQVDSALDSTESRMVVTVDLEHTVEPLLPHFFSDTIELPLTGIATVSTDRSL